MFTLAEKVALVTGGSSGIGRATAIAFAQTGANVVVASRRIEEGNQTVAMIQQLGGNAIFVQMDVTQETQVEAAITRTVERFGRLDCAFNNAGIEQDAQPLIEQTEATFDQIMTINVKGVWLCLKHQIAQMLKNDGGVIVNNTSMADSVGFPGVPIYVASKHAVLGLTRAIALEYAASNIRVNAVSPGAIDTEMFERFAGDNPALRSQMMAMHPVGRIGKPEEIAAAVVYLCSEQAGFITGHSLKLDGGYVAA